MCLCSGAAVSLACIVLSFLLLYFCFFIFFFFLMIRRPPKFTLFPSPPLFRFNDTATTEIESSVGKECRSRWSPYHFLCRNSPGRRIVLKAIRTGLRDGAGV